MKLAAKFEKKNYKFRFYFMLFTLKNTGNTPFLDHYINACHEKKVCKLSLYVLLSAETKNQWARDDPAFVVICILLLAVSAVAYSAA